MQNPSAIRTRSRTAATPARELSWSFMLLVVLCACVVAVGFFFAARQHFTSMDYSIKNSKLREQLQNLETEKRRLLLAREVASSPLAIRKAANALGMRNEPEMAAAQVSDNKDVAKSENVTSESAKQIAAKSSDRPSIVKTVLAVPAQSKPTGETRSRIVESSKKEKTEVAALLKLR